MNAVDGIRLQNSEQPVKLIDVIKPHRHAADVITRRADVIIAHRTCEDGVAVVVVAVDARGTARVDAVMTCSERVASRHNTHITSTFLL